MGLIVSPICYSAMAFLKPKLGYDDALDAFGCHGIGGMVGGVLTGIFCVPDLSWTDFGGLLYTGDPTLLIAQIEGILITIVFVAVMSAIIGLVVKVLFKGSLRVSAEEEAEALMLASTARAHTPRQWPGLTGSSEIRKEPSMKKIEAIVRPAKLEALKDAFLEAGIKGMTISQVQGCGNQHGWKEYYRGSEVIVNMLPKIMLTVVVEDDKVNSTVELICNTARTGEVGDGKIFVSPVEQVVRIRTGESGEGAV